MDYPIPPWIRGVSAGEIGQLTQESTRATAQIALEQQKLAQDQVQSQMMLQAKQQQMKQDDLRQQQQLQIQKAYQDAQIGLRSQQLEQTKQSIAIKTQQAARTFQAQQQAQVRIKAGEDPSKVWMELGPQMGLNSSALGALARKPMNFGGASAVEGLPEDYKQVMTGPASRRIMHIPPTATGTNAPPPIPAMGPDGEKLGFWIAPPGGGKTIFRGMPHLSTGDALAKQIEERSAAMKAKNAPQAPPKVDTMAIKAQKAKFANALAKQHPDWSRSRIIEETHKEFDK